MITLYTHSLLEQELGLDIKATNFANFTHLFESMSLIPEDKGQKKPVYLTSLEFTDRNNEEDLTILITTNITEVEDFILMPDNRETLEKIFVFECSDYMEALSISKGFVETSSLSGI